MISRRDHVLLIGMMGSGKTTVGQLLANKLARRYFDSDTAVEQHTGKTVAAIFRSDGEAAFRKFERQVLEEACASDRPAVIAVAGGAVLDPDNRQLIATSGRAVWLRADPATLARRVGDGSGRPLLEGDVKGTLVRLDAERRPMYEALSDLVVDVDEVDADVVTDRLIGELRRRVVVALGDRSYEVLIGPNTKSLLKDVIPASARRVAIVTQASIDLEIDVPIEAETFIIKEGEAAKSLGTIEDLCRGFARFGLSRKDVVIAVGGGVVTDTGGFAAACYHRGTPVVHLATTLLGQIDAAIGGKTGVNIAEGKNLVGAFYQPSGVLCDTDLLASLPEREWRSGLGEMAKYAFLGVEDLDKLCLTEQVARCVACKAEIVASDEKESGRRAILNYGHTLAHALEAAGFAENETTTDGVDLRHGEAVAIGLVFAARLAHRLGRIDAARVARHVDLVCGYRLPTTLPKGVDLELLIDFMGRDKKASGGLSFVLDGPNGVELVDQVDKSLVKQILMTCMREPATATTAGRAITGSVSL